MTSTCRALLFLSLLASTWAGWPWKHGIQDENGTAPATASKLTNVKLMKQYVPVEKNGKILAYKTAYFGEVFVGTPGKTFTVVFDTGSGHFILPRMSCQTTTCAKHRRYDGKASASAEDIEYDGTPINPSATARDQVVVSFGTGKVTGEFVKDYVCIGVSADDGDCVMLRLVLAVDMTEDPFGLFAFDGVLGLGLNALTLDPKFSFFGEMVAQNPTMQPQFSVFLARHEGGESVISFGGHDPEKADGELSWAPIAMQELGYWQVQIKSVKIGDQVLEECADGSCRAVLDTGTSLLGVPRLAARSLHRMLARPLPPEFEGKSDVDCRHVAGHSIDFEIGESVVNVPAEDYSRPAPFNMSVPVNDTNVTKLFCRSLLLPIDMKAPLGPKIFIWGEPVLRRYLTIYDFGKKQIGFALARQPEEAPEGPSSSIGLPEESSLLAGAPLRKPPAAAPKSPSEEKQTEAAPKAPTGEKQTGYSVIDHNGETTQPRATSSSEAQVTI